MDSQTDRHTHGEMHITTRGYMWTTSVPYAFGGWIS